MRMMGEQFVTGETIDEALHNARTMEAEGFRYSYDMLGEAALTRAEDASATTPLRAGHPRHWQRPLPGAASTKARASPSSSALHPRYSRAQFDRVMDELYPLVLRLTVLAKQYDIGLNIDAGRNRPAGAVAGPAGAPVPRAHAGGWNGIGFVIQAYQKRCPFVIDYVVDLAAAPSRRLMVRLVKGAYWDSEIKRAQVDGLAGLPGLHPQGAHRRVHRLRQEAAGGARRRLPPVRHAQR